MTDPIGTAQERELIEAAATSATYLVAYADTVAKAMYRGERTGGIWNLERAVKLLRDQSDALQSRIAEVGRLEPKATSYDWAHEDAVEMGYPSLTEALEDLERLRNAKAG